MWKISISLKTKQTNKLNKFQFDDRVNLFWALVNRLNSPSVFWDEYSKISSKWFITFWYFILTVISPG